MTNVESRAFNIRVILLVFYTDANIPLLKDLLKMMHMGEQRKFLDL